MGFGGMTLLAAVVYELVVYQGLNLKTEGEKWTFGKWTIHNLATMLLISLANFLFARLLLFGYIDWNLFPQMVYSTFMIGIIPIVMLGGLALYGKERKYQTIANEINKGNTHSSYAKASKSPILFDIPAEKIRYIEALQNYIRIGYMAPEGRFKVITERMTLKEIAAKTADSPIIKCHRSFLVNRDTITNTSGNAQGLLLTLSDCDKIIPVSRVHVPIFRKP